MERDPQDPLARHEGDALSRHDGDALTPTEGETLDPLDESYTPPAEEASLWEDFVDVYFSPAQVFARRRDARWGKPMLALIGASLLLYVALIGPNSRIMMASIEQANPEAAAQLGQGRMSTIMMVFGGLAVPVMMLLTTAWAAVLLMGLGRLVDVRPSFRQAMVIATYAAFVFLLAQVAIGVMVILQGSGELNAVKDLSFGALRFVEDPMALPGAVLPLVQRVDLFAIWQAVLWGVGARAMLGASTGQAAGLAGLTWVLYALPQVALGALTGGPAAMG